jgi:hypothetical protein
MHIIWIKIWNWNYLLGTERSTLKSLQLYQVEFSQNLTFYMALLKDCIARADSSFKSGSFWSNDQLYIEDHFYYNWSTLNLYAKRWDLCWRQYNKSSLTLDGYSKPAPTSTPSTRWILLLSCGWTSIELIFSFTLVTNSAKNNSHIYIYIYR